MVNIIAQAVPEIIHLKKKTVELLNFTRNISLFWFKLNVFTLDGQNELLRNISPKK